MDEHLQAIPDPDFRDRMMASFQHRLQHVDRLHEGMAPSADEHAGTAVHPGAVTAPRQAPRPGGAPATMTMGRTAPAPRPVQPRGAV